MSQSSSAEPRPKLSVFTDQELMRLVRHERADTGRHIRDIVNARLRHSYAAHPGPLEADRAAS